MRAIRVGSRGSPLARRQAEMVMERLRALHPGLEVSLRIVRTAGDRDRKRPLITPRPSPEGRGDPSWSALGGAGVFVRELEEALRRGEADLAVHSLKDLPTEPAPGLPAVAGLALAAIPERGDVREALVSKGRVSLDDMASGDRIGTESLRRAVQLKGLRPDLEVVGIRGNVDTRLRKLAQGEVEGLLLAAAGLERLGRLAEAAQVFPPDYIIPAPGQGALAIQCRQEDEELLELLAPLEHRESRLAVTAERALLRALGGGCRLPLAAWGRLQGEALVLLGLVAAADGSRIYQAQEEGPAEAPEELGQRLAQRLLALGAEAIFAGRRP